MTQMIVLALDGEAILLRNITVSATMQLPDKDMSGQSTSTTSAQQGNKAKELRVSGVIDFNDEAILTRIFQLAEATESNGAKKTYRIANATAKAINMRQGVFSGGIDATEQQGKMHWQVTFTLREKLSVPEKASARSGSQKTIAKQQTQNGSELTPDKGMNTQETFWKNINDGIGSGLDWIGIGSVKKEGKT
ncbi:TPA: hypothetical protein ACNTH0_004446 [Escherichia coli]|uniref:Nucleoid DNA-binding protein n=1 Tax=Escherichia albertii (strain TW07627) TaxID=502347 RepID=A0ABC9NKU2_ESCAT|nr:MULTISPECIES: hypothetical protein [Escherichia]EDQ8645800.1 hypothetical protein [Salmonella enterica subsp. enterica serovar Bere]EDS90908.1 nucleoid DNA-binding protein [Escherichia albertii TW07627]EDX40680.1 nucleoid DNA-binding protein [Escherichia coli 101-1]EEZ4653229.1 hypothetical protein [Escherichia coli]EFD3769315.1 hypothetical protein [Escherichia coli]